MSRSSANAFTSAGSLRVVGQDAQLDLRIIGRQERPAREAGDERLADLAAVLGAHGDVLQVRVGGAEPARRRDDLVERGVDAAVLVGQGRQGVEVGALELLQLAMLDDQAGQGVRGGEFLQDLDGGARLPLGGLLGRGELQLVEQDLPQLRARADVELAAGLL